MPFCSLSPHCYNRKQLTLLTQFRKHQLSYVAAYQRLQTSLFLLMSCFVSCCFVSHSFGCPQLVSLSHVCLVNHRTRWSLLLLSDWGGTLTDSSVQCPTPATVPHWCPRLPVSCPSKGGGAGRLRWSYQLLSILCLWHFHTTWIKHQLVNFCWTYANKWIWSFPLICHHSAKIGLVSNNVLSVKGPLGWIDMLITDSHPGAGLELFYVSVTFLCI